MEADGREEVGMREDMKGVAATIYAAGADTVTFIHP